ncbi:helix-turn-helix domain-containing protein [Streptomyces sp. WM6378]|uniref:helix-turn-helix domain-containing protein n=1 Tax=Streptomyces sp. WM6378 TaxID=1415557 RepID=UPI0006AEBE29|nr:helix-turn-helix transcriptional regulator [Streptomyces sp. WM6378]KOU50222.1 hypothetical protein ADK54_09680 [Streptomyces sp. WM6378]
MTGWDETMKAFGRDLGMLRSEAGLTVKDLGKKIGRAPSTISKLQTGKLLTPPDLEVVSAWVKACADEAGVKGIVLTEAVDTANWEKKHELLRGAKARASSATHQTAAEMWIPGAKGRVEGSASLITVLNRQDKVVFRLAHGTPRPPRLTQDQARRQPSQLLDTDREWVGFVGGNAPLERLRLWCKPSSDRPRIRLRLLRGPAGQGKSRLAAHFAAARCNPGNPATNWTTFHVLQEGSPATASQRPSLPRVAGAQGYLLIVDDIERWRLEDLENLLYQCKQQQVGEIRILFITRSSGMWWARISNYASDLGMEVDEQDLPSVTGELDRGLLFAGARKSFAKVLRPRPQPDTPVPDLSGDGFATVLAIHMAALADVHAQCSGDRAPHKPEQVAAYLLGREAQHWASLAATTRMSTDPWVLAQVVYTAALTGPLTQEDAILALEGIKVSQAHDPYTILADHTTAYPAHREGTVLQPLLPDTLAEAYIALCLPQRNPSDGLPTGLAMGPWVSAAPARLLTSALQRSKEDREPQAFPRWGRSALLTLIETAARWNHVATGQLAPLLQADPKLIQKTGSIGLSRLCAVDPFPRPVLAAVYQALPLDDVELNAGAAELVKLLAPAALARAQGDPATEAKVRAHIGSRYQIAFQYTEAAAEFDRVVPIMQALTAGTTREDLMAGGRPVERLKDRALYLDWAGIAYEYNDEFDKALAATQKAIEICDLLIEAGHTEQRLRLTFVLANLAGRHRIDAEGRLKAAQRAVGICQELEKEPLPPGSAPPELAGALQNVAAAQHTLGNHRAARDAAQEAALIRRVQNKNNFGRYAPHLHDALYQLARELTCTGQHREAALIHAERTALLRELAAADENNYGPYLYLAEAERSGSKSTRFQSAFGPPG